MVKIEKEDFASLSFYGHTRFHTRFNESRQNNIYNGQPIETKFVAYSHACEVKVDELKASLKLLRDDIIDAMKKRAKILRDMKCKINKIRHDKTGKYGSCVVKAAKKVSSVLDGYGCLEEVPASCKTKKCRQLIDGLNYKWYKNFVDLLGLSGSVTELDEVNNHLGVLLPKKDREEWLALFGDFKVLCGFLNLTFMDCAKEVNEVSDPDTRRKYDALVKDVNAQIKTLLETEFD